MLAIGFSFISGLGIGAAAVVAVTVIASITLLPALLGFAGHTIDKLSVRGRSTREGHTRASLWFRWSRVVQRRPWPAFVGGLLLLLVLAIPLLSIRLETAPFASKHA